MKKTKQAWVNVYPKGAYSEDEGDFDVIAFGSKEQADEWQDDNRTPRLGGQAYFLDLTPKPKSSRQS